MGGHHYKEIIMELPFALKEELDKADLNNMTPLQAFDLLRNMKEQFGI